MVYHRKKVQRSTFRKLPLGAVYWPVSGTGSAPLVKTGRASTAGALGTDSLTQTSVADITAAVVKVPGVFKQPVRR